MGKLTTIEPRWYYNIEKRAGKSRPIAGNNANFITLRINYHPDWFVTSNREDVEVISDLNLIPTWGIRRNIGRHFTYELGIGLGYCLIFYKQSGSASNADELAANLHLRAGYPGFSQALNVEVRVSMRIYRTILILHASL